MGDKQRGLYEKFTVSRTDGTSGPQEKHEGCSYFVLDLNHDPLVVPALCAYAAAARSAGYVPLADDLEWRIAEMTAGERGPGHLDPQAVDERDTLRAQVAKAAAALRPFAIAHTLLEGAGLDGMPNDVEAVALGSAAMTFGVFRQAAAVLAEIEAQP